MTSNGGCGVSDSLVRSLGFALAAVIVLGTGVWLTRSGWPFGAALVAVHKLVALLATVVLGILVYRATRTAPLTGADLAFVISAGVLIVVSFASGGVASASSNAPVWVLWVHRLATWVATGAAAACLIRVA